MRSNSVVSGCAKGAAIWLALVVVGYLIFVPRGAAEPAESIDAPDVAPPSVAVVEAAEVGEPEPMFPPNDEPVPER